MRKRPTLEELVKSGAQVAGFSKLAKVEPRKPKYNNVKSAYDGVVFDSKKERDRWVFLYSLERQGLISNLERQVKYDIVVNGNKVCSYLADFRYIKDGVTIVEDIKSAVTKKLPVYRLKNKLLFACYGIRILET